MSFYEARVVNQFGTSERCLFESDHLSTAISKLKHLDFKNTCEELNNPELSIDVFLFLVQDFNNDQLAPPSDRIPIAKKSFFISIKNGALLSDYCD